MEIWNDVYYVHSRICLKPFGLWPFQEARKQLIFRISTTLAVSTVLIPHIVMTYELRHQFHYFLLCMPSLLYYAHSVTKFLHIAIKVDKARNLLEIMNRDFSYFKGKSLHILHDYSETARKFNNFYLMYMCSSVFLYNSTVFIPHTLDILRPLNESRPRRPIRYVRYHIPGIDDNFNFILVHGLIFDLVAILVIVGYDTLLFNCAQHACALFKIVAAELRDSILLPSHTNFASESLRQRQNLVYQRIANSIIIHKHALEFADDLDSLCSIVNLLVVSISLSTATFTEFETIVHKDAFDVMIRFAFFTIGQFFNILYCNYPGQLVKDHSLLVRNFCYELEWYREDISIGGKKLLILIMLRSQKPSCLTGRKLFVLDLENFVKVLKASLSYFAVLRSVQQ